MKKANNNRGFTLIELIVSISIITLITGLFLADYKSANRKAELNAAADQLVSDLRLAQSYALGAKKNEKNGNTVPAGGWGLYLELNHNNYIVFADGGGSGGGNLPHQYNSGGDDYDYLTVNLVGNSQIEIAGFSAPPLAADSNSIVFLPPDPTIYFNGGQAAAVATVTLRDKSTGQTKNVAINSFGLIDVE